MPVIDLLLPLINERGLFAAYRGEETEAGEKEEKRARLTFGQVALV